MLENDDSLDAVGKRLSILRTIAEYDREGLSKAARVTTASISYWENANGGVISAKSMEKLVAAFRAKGINCTEDWLRKGIGDWPGQYGQRQGKTPKKVHTEIDLNTLRFNSEIEQFILMEAQNDREAIITKIENSSMMPAVEKGDFVGGILVPISSLDLTRDRICIIKLGDKIDVRRVRKGKSSELFNLSYFSYDQDCRFPLEMNDVELKFVAPVLRIWR
jgi:transcriptional regulator with XRE-family HTH domain